MAHTSFLIVTVTIRRTSNNMPKINNEKEYSAPQFKCCPVEDMPALVRGDSPF